MRWLNCVLKRSPSRIRWEIALERWKIVVHRGVTYPYEVSDHGRLRRTKDNKILRTADVHGYQAVHLHRNGKRWSVLMHTLVAFAFLPDAPTADSYGLGIGKLQINHKNGIKTDNLVKNLAWCSPSANQCHATANGLFSQGEKHYAAKVTVQDVREIRKLSSDGASSYEIANSFPLTPRVIRGIINRETWKHVA